MPNQSEISVIKRGQLRKTNRQGGATISDLRDAAKAVLVREGAAGFTLERVAKEASVTKGTLLYHFHTKDKLLEHLADDYVQHLQIKLEEGIAQARMDARYKDSADMTVAGFIRWYRAFRKADASYTSYGLTLLSLSAGHPVLLQKVRAWYEELFAKVRSSSCVEALNIVLLLEGLFFLGHFRLDVTTDEEIERLLSRLEAML